jgi:hypothetical protein
MTELFREKYIQRTEHDQVVAHYIKLVANLYRQVRELREAGHAAGAIDAMVASEKRRINRVLADAMHETEESASDNDNVIRIDFANRR